MLVIRWEEGGGAEDHPCVCLGVVVGAGDGVVVVLEDRHEAGGGGGNGCGGGGAPTRRKPKAQYSLPIARHPVPRHKDPTTRTTPNIGELSGQAVSVGPAVASSICRLTSHQSACPELVESKSEAGWWGCRAGRVQTIAALRSWQVGSAGAMCRSYM